MSRQLTINQSRLILKYEMGDLLVGYGVLGLSSGAGVNAEEVERRLVLLWLQGIPPGRAPPPRDSAQPWMGKSGQRGRWRGLLMLPRQIRSWNSIQRWRDCEELRWRHVQHACTQWRCIVNAAGARCCLLLCGAHEIAAG